MQLQDTDSQLNKGWNKGRIQVNGERKWLLGEEDCKTKEESEQREDSY